LRRQLCRTSIINFVRIYAHSSDVKGKFAESLEKGIKLKKELKKNKRKKPL